MHKCCIEVSPFHLPGVHSPHPDFHSSQSSLDISSNSSISCFQPKANVRVSIAHSLDSIWDLSEFFRIFFSRFSRYFPHLEVSSSHGGLGGSFRGRECCGGVWEMNRCRTSVNRIFSRFFGFFLVFFPEYLEYFLYLGALSSCSSSGGSFQWPECQGRGRALYGSPPFQAAVLRILLGLPQLCSGWWQLNWGA